MVIIGNIGALDRESYQFIDHLLGLTHPESPKIVEDGDSFSLPGVLFTADSSYRSVGIAFAHEGFAKVYWFQKLLRVEDLGPPPANGRQPPPSYGDSGVLFYAYEVPKPLMGKELEYRLIINGLWTIDPNNPLRRRDEKTGLLHSVVTIPYLQRPPSVLGGPQDYTAPDVWGLIEKDTPPASLTFTYSAPSGEIITVAGDFNGWDPFMYELTEFSPGRYSLVLPLPPGTYHYVFYRQGRRFTDPNNRNTVYSKTGDAVSEVVLR